MKIKKITSRNRRDFHAVYVCEHCGFECEDYGYDDDYFHNHVIPNKVCPKCGKKAPETYKPETPLYPADMTV